MAQFLASWAVRLSLPGVISSALFFSVLAVTTCAEPSDYGAFASTEPNAAAQTFLNQKLLLWQKRLRLQDWNISVRLAPVENLRPKTLGNINWDRKAKSAVISVMSPGDYKLTGSAMLDDMEMTVVHELVHLHLSGLPRNEDTKKVEEQAVNMLAEALIRLDRKQFDADAPARHGEESTERARQQTSGKSDPRN
jgi:hypothetical protein